jgi:hypothetical protein
MAAMLETVSSFQKSFFAHVNASVVADRVI